MKGKEAYQKYSQTDTWKIIMAQRLSMDSGECLLCGKEAEVVHHRRYPKILGTETVMDLVSLCRKCHDLYHEDKVEKIQIEVIDPERHKKELFRLAGEEIGNLMGKVIKEYPTGYYSKRQFFSAIKIAADWDIGYHPEEVGI